MVSDEIRHCLIARTRNYMEQIIDGIRSDTVDVEIIDRVWDACEEVLRTPPSDDDRGSWLYRLERPWADTVDPQEYVRLMELEKQ